MVTLEGRARLVAVEVDHDGRLGREADDAHVGPGAQAAGDDAGDELLLLRPAGVARAIRRECRAIEFGTVRALEVSINIAFTNFRAPNYFGWYYPGSVT